MKKLFICAICACFLSCKEKPKTTVLERFKINSAGRWVLRTNYSPHSKNESLRKYQDTYWQLTYTFTENNGMDYTMWSSHHLVSSGKDATFSDFYFDTEKAAKGWLTPCVIKKGTFKIVRMQPITKNSFLLNSMHNDFKSPCK